MNNSPTYNSQRTPKAYGTSDLNAAAICADYIMETGSHYASFIFHKFNGDNSDEVPVDYEIGVMRPLSPELWDKMKSNRYCMSDMTSSFSLYSECKIEIFNRDRSLTKNGKVLQNKHWQGWRDRCTMSPRATWTPYKKTRAIDSFY